VAAVAAWLVGIALRASDILPPRAAPWTWLALAGACVMLATLAALLTPLLAQSRLRLLYLALRLLLMTGILAAFVALGATLTLGWIALPLLWYADRAIEVCAALPFAALTVGDVPALAIFAYYSALALAVWGVPGLIRRMRERAQAAPGAATQFIPIHGVPHKAGHVRVGVRVMASLALVAVLASAGAALPALANGATARQS